MFHSHINIVPLVELGLQVTIHFQFSVISKGTFINTEDKAGKQCAQYPRPFLEFRHDSFREYVEYDTDGSFLQWSLISVLFNKFV